MLSVVFAATLYYKFSKTGVVILPTCFQRVIIKDVTNQAVLG